MCIAISAHTQVGCYKSMRMQFNVLNKDLPVMYIDGIIALYL